MFENCGSCFAAEQFVDIKLGAKYLLTLTSYYGRSDKNESNHIYIKCRTPEEDDMLDMMINGGKRVSLQNLKAVTEWYKSLN